MEKNMISVELAGQPLRVSALLCCIWKSAAVNNFSENQLSQNSEKQINDFDVLACNVKIRLQCGHLLNKYMNDLFN
jgi:hypothetical protein